MTSDHSHASRRAVYRVHDVHLSSLSKSRTPHFLMIPISRPPAKKNSRSLNQTTSTHKSQLHQKTLYTPTASHSTSPYRPNLSPTDPQPPFLFIATPQINPPPSRFYTKSANLTPTDPTTNPQPLHLPTPTPPRPYVQRISIMSSKRRESRLCACQDRQG